jgi:hypothetical protein
MMHKQPSEPTTRKEKEKGKTKKKPGILVVD